MNPLTVWVGLLYQAGALLYLLAAVARLLKGKVTSLVVLCLGLLANLGSIGLKLYLSWPMQSPYQEPFWLPAALALLTLGFARKGHDFAAKSMVFVTAILALAGALFPNDCYLPFPRSNSILAHLFLPMSVLGKALFYAAGAQALMFLLGYGQKTGEQKTKPIFNRLMVWGFVIFTLSLFLAEAWSYLGWASPVIWNNATMTSTMAVWFYYGCYLHLYLLRAWPMRRRAWFAVAGLPLLIVFTLLPEIGGFKWPEWLA